MYSFHRRPHLQLVLLILELCSADQSPGMKADDGSEQIEAEVGQLRQTRANDAASSKKPISLPFSATDYRQDVHSGVDKYIASNSVGIIKSGDCHIRASK